MARTLASEYKEYYDFVRNGAQAFYKEWQNEDWAVVWSEWVVTYIAWLNSHRTDAEYWASEDSRAALDTWITEFENWHDHALTISKTCPKVCPAPDKNASPGIQRTNIADALHKCINLIDPCYRKFHDLFEEYGTWYSGAIDRLAPIDPINNIVLADDKDVRAVAQVDVELMTWREQKYKNLTGHSPQQAYIYTGSDQARLDVAKLLPGGDSAFGLTNTALLIGGLIVGLGAAVALAYVGRSSR